MKRAAWVVMPRLARWQPPTRRPCSFCQALARPSSASASARCRSPSLGILAAPGCVGGQVAIAPWSRTAECSSSRPSSPSRMRRTSASPSMLRCWRSPGVGTHRGGVSSALRLCRLRVDQDHPDGFPFKRARGRKARRPPRPWPHDPTVGAGASGRGHSMLYRRALVAGAQASSRRPSSPARSRPRGSHGSDAWSRVVHAGQPWIS